MGYSLHNDIKVVSAVAQTAAGTTDVNGAIIDMAGYEGVLFIVMFGTLTATQVTKIKAQQDTDPAGGTMADLAGTLSAAMGDSDSGKGLVLDVFRPAKRYVRCVVDRGTANAVVDRGVAILYNPTTKPQALDTATIISQEVHVAPIEGTA
jgi:hypothetical protein